MFRHAVVRTPGRNFALGLTTANLGPPKFDLVLEQHDAYVRTLRSLGLDVIVLDAEPDYPDAYFVEDTAVVTPNVAVITNPGAASRRGEEKTIEPVLARFRKTARIAPPATVEGGDVLMAGNHFFIGISERTNPEGARRLGRILEEHGHTWTTVQVGEGLHLKSSVNFLGRDTLLITESLAGHRAFRNFKKVVLDRGEDYAANTLWVNDSLLMPAGFPGARRKLSTLGFPLFELDVSEVRKMDGGLTCLSLRF
jgi:dimethylargininase